MKRFYKECGIGTAEGGFSVTLDGRPVQTPARVVLALPTAPLAEAIAEEWRVQGETVVPDTMPLMRLATTAVDRVTAEREAVTGDLVSFGGGDLLCYRAESPAELVERQSAGWQPLIDWVAAHHDAALAVTSGLVAIEQPAPSLAVFRRVLEGLDAFELMVVQTVTASTGSLVVALALYAGQLDGTQAFEAGALDDLYGLEIWGEDKDARERLDGLCANILAAERMLQLLRA